MVAHMNRLENAARVAMGDDGLMAVPELPAPVARLSSAGRIALAIAAITVLAFLLAELI
jgi:hypothetical protein